MDGVELKKVWKKYGKIEAVKEVNFRCESGELFCLLGPSGAGKTSILKMIAGVEAATSGEIIINGTLANTIKPQERNVAMMFENYALYPHLNVFENMASPLRSSKSRKSLEEIKKTVNRIAEMLSIGELLDRYPGQLSGGQKQRVALGRVLVRRPSLFLLDEPISHLDAKLRHGMRLELRKIHKEIGASFIYATPDQIEAMSMADRIAVLNLGILQQIGTPNELYNNPVNKFVANFIGEPPMNILEFYLQEKNGNIMAISDAFEFEIPKELSFKIKNLTEDRKVEIGVRPVDISIVSEPVKENLTFPAEVYIIESLGRYTIITLKIRNKLLKLRTEEHIRIKEGEKVNITFNYSNISLFDINSQNALI